ncbi:MAG TPA: hypothetical protein VHQ20_01605 [Patescibacteria group bacterium]|nr:hypothetical protein [Patescibacteria group bacterium]
MFDTITDKFFNPRTSKGNRNMIIFAMLAVAILAAGILFAPQIARPGQMQSVQIWFAVKMIIPLLAILIGFKNLIKFARHGEVGL